MSEALAGQREAFAALVRRYQDYAYGVAVAMLSDFHLARDVVQEAFLCSYRDLAKLRDPGRFGGWLRGIVRHTAHRALRELGRIRSLADELGHRAQVFAATPPPDEAAEEAERREFVYRALERLSEKNREAMSLYYVDGLSYAEIADFLDVSETTVQGRLQRGRAQLRKELKMVAETFKEHELPEDFSAEIQRLLDVVDRRGVERHCEIDRFKQMGAAAVDPLCEALGDPRPRVVRAAANALCAIGDARALGPILRLLYADRLWRMELCGDGRLLGIPGVREELLRLVREGAGDEGWALQVLSYARDDQEVRGCIADAFHRTYSGDSFLALCRIASEEKERTFAEALRGASPRLRSFVLWLAMREGFLPPIDACLAGLADGVAGWARLQAGSLMLQHGEEGKATLERLTRSGSRAERAAAAAALVRTGHEEALEALRNEFRRTQHDNTWLATMARVLVRHYGAEILDRVAAGELGSANVHAIVWALAKAGASPPGAAVEALYREGAPAVRAAALRILVRERGAEMLPELRRCLREGKPAKLAQEAFWQVLRLGDAALPMAQEMLGSNHWPERKAAVCLLRRWGKLAEQQEAEAESDPHIAVRHAAR